MNLDMIQPEYETEDLLLSITKSCQTLIHKTPKKPEETLDIKITRSKGTFSYKPPVSTEGSWMIGLLSLQFFKSVFIITKENNKVLFYTDTSNEFSFAELKDSHYSSL